MQLNLESALYRCPEKVLNLEQKTLLQPLVLEIQRRPTLVSGYLAALEKISPGSMMKLENKVRVTPKDSLLHQFIEVVTTRYMREKKMTGETFDAAYAFICWVVDETNEPVYKV